MVLYFFYNESVIDKQVFYHNLYRIKGVKYECSSN